MRKLLVASRNGGKIKEFSALLMPAGYQVLSLLDLPAMPEVVEDGTTFHANARLKAEQTSLATGLPVLADDSGLVVYYLGGAPGVHSARFALPEEGDQANSAKLLRLLDGVPTEKRQAHFEAVLAFARPGHPTQFTEGRLFGTIGFEPRGKNGFGYDPLFYLPELGKTTAELAPEEKNRLSHRGKALVKMLSVLENIFPQ